MKVYESMEKLGDLVLEYGDIEKVVSVIATENKEPVKEEEKEVELHPIFQNVFSSMFGVK